MERAMMTLQRPQEYAKVTRRYLLEAIADSPDETPAYLFAHALEQVIAAYKANRVPLGETVATWAMLDRALLLRELGGGDEVAAIAALHKHYRLQMRTTLPDCQQLRANFEEGILLKTLPKGGCESFLVLYGLQQCDAPDLWAAAFGLRLAAGDAAWLQRMAGEEAYNRGLFEQSRTYWLRAVALEQDIHLQAADHLQIAQAWLAQQDYRKARASLHTAMQLHATWGEPYVRLMDVYLEGSKACGWNAFDHKALHWLLTDLCSQLLNVDPNYTLQANERLYAYRRAAPSIEEAAIHGFKAGDTYPLKCWMSTSTAVPLD